MRKHIKTPTIGEFLNEEFFIPMGLSAYKVAQAINVPVSRIQDILHDRRRITVDTSLRLAKFLGVSDDYFISLQDDIDIRNLKTELSEELDEIKPFAAVNIHCLKCTADSLFVGHSRESISVFRNILTA